MPFTPVRGRYCKIVDNAATPNIYPGVNWSIDVDANGVNTSNFRDGRQYTGTLEDATLKFTMVFDEDDPPDKASDANIRQGVQMTLKVYMNTAQTLFMSMPVTFSKVTYQNKGLEEILMLDVEAKLNGTITYPIWT